MTSFGDVCLRSFLYFFFFLSDQNQFGKTERLAKEFQREPPHTFLKLMCKILYYSDGDFGFQLTKQKKNSKSYEKGKKT